MRSAEAEQAAQYTVTIPEDFALCNFQATATTRSRQDQVIFQASVVCWCDTGDLQTKARMLTLS